MNLTYVTKLLKQRDTLTHYEDLARAIIDFLDANRARTPGINGALIILDWDKLSFIIKHQPVRLNKQVYLVTHSLVKVG
jgi:hypothetical protein